MKRINLYVYLCLLIFLNACLNKPAFEIVKRIEPDDDLEKIIVYSFNDQDSTIIVSLDLTNGKVISQKKIASSNSKIYFFPKSSSEIVEKSRLFDSILSLNNLRMWRSDLDRRYVYQSYNNILLFDPDSKSVSLNRKKINLSENILEELMADSLRGGVYPWVNRLVLFEDDIALLKTVFIDSYSSLKTKILKQDIGNNVSVDSLLLDLEITDVVQNLSNSGHLMFHKDCGIYKYNSHIETAELLLEFPERTEICSNVSLIESDFYVYVVYDSGALGYTKELKLYSVEKQSSKKLFSIKAKFGHEAGINYGIAEKKK